MLTVNDPVNWAEPKDNVGIEDNYCIQCGRKTGKTARWVQVSTSGRILAADYEDKEGEQESQGFWSVGSECAKQFDPNVLWLRL